MKDIRSLPSAGRPANTRSLHLIPPPSTMPYPEGNRFAVATKDDARAWPWVFGLLSLIFSTLAVAARVAARRKKLVWSDWCLGKAASLPPDEWQNNR